MMPIQQDRFNGELFRQVYTAAGRAEVREAVESIYANLKREIDLRKPVCNTSGRCCRFEEYGHRMFVTTIELAAFVYHIEMQDVGQLPDRTLWDGTGCPFQTNGLCSVHAIRPFGCRIFFCDASSSDWQHEQYERFHAELKQIHESLGVPYHYLEWRSALAALGIGRINGDV